MWSPTKLVVAARADVRHMVQVQVYLRLPSSWQIMWLRRRPRHSFSRPAAFLYEPAPQPEGPRPVPATPNPSAGPASYAYARGKHRPTAKYGHTADVLFTYTQHPFPAI